MSYHGLLDLIAIRTQISFLAVLEHFDLTPEQPGTKQIKIRCPFHEDQTPSCSINLERGIYKCFGCSASGNVLDFIADMEGITDNPAYNAALIALDIMGQKPEAFQKPQERHTATKGQKTKRSPAKAKKAAERANLASEADMPPAPTKTSNPPIDIELVLDHEHEFLSERGITPEVAEAFGIGHCRTGIMKNRIAVPIHNPVGELIAFTGRWADENNRPDKQPRYKLPKGFEKSLELFNLHRAAALGKPYVVVVEGIWSVLRLHTAGIPVVALLGTDVSNAQASLLAETGFKYAVLILDGDDAGMKATPSAAHILSQSLYVKTLVLPAGIKPDTMDQSLINRLSR